MRLELSSDLVIKMTLDKYPQQGVPYKDWKPAAGLNYLVYDSHRESPVGFAVRIGKKASVYLVEKHVAGKNMKIPVGLARGKKGDETIMELAEARLEAHKLVAKAKAHGANPKAIEDAVVASELTMGQVWEGYIHDLETRNEPIKPNSRLALDKARAKLSDWEDRKVRLITSDEIIKRFDLHAIEKKHKTAAEQMGRWATAAVANAIKDELHNAHSAGRAPVLTFNPFTILIAKGKYRTGKQLEREYKAKGIRNPLDFSSTVGPFVKAAWEYRLENPLAADFLLLCLLWGMRGDECRTFKWRDRIDDAMESMERWVDMEKKVAFVFDAKNRGDHEFPIGPFAMEILKLRRLDRTEDDMWVFPSRSPKKLGKQHYNDATVALNTVRERAGIKTVRGHDMRRTFGAACEKLGFSDRQTKRMLGHGVAAGESLGRYTDPEWIDLVRRMERVEELIMVAAKPVYNALRPRSVPRLSDGDDVQIKPKTWRPTKRKIG